MSVSDVLARDVLDVLTDTEEAATWLKELRLFGSPDDAFVRFRGQDHYPQAFSTKAFDGVEIAVGGGPRELEAGAVVVSVAGAPDPENPVVLCELNPQDVEEHRGRIYVPTGAAAAIALLVNALPSVESADATVLEPASQLGPKAMEELFAQTVALLNHRPLETSVLGDRLAFNVLAGRGSLAGLASLVSCPVRSRSMLVPVFGGTTIALTLHLGQETSTEAVVECLRAAPGIDYSEDDDPAHAQPAGAVGDASVRCGLARVEGSVVSLLAVVDEVRREAVSLLRVASEIVAQDAF